MLDYKIYALEKNRAIYEKCLRTQYNFNKNCAVKIVENGVILPTRYIKETGRFCGGVNDDKMNFVTGLCRGEYPSNGLSGGYGEVCANYHVEQDEIQLCNETVVFDGVLIGQFGHMIIECLSRLWWHIKNPDSNYKFIFVTSGPGYKPWMNDLIDLLQINKDRIIFLQKPTHFSKIIVPEESVHFIRGYFEEYSLIYDFMMKSALAKIKDVKKLPKKIYLTKRFYNFGGDITVNEEFFENFYRKQGYTVIAPEKLPIFEQISCIANADKIATLTGTPALFSLFAKNEAVVDILVKSDDNARISPATYIATNISNIYLNLIDVCMGFLPSNYMQGVHFVGPTKCWNEYVKDLYGDKYNNEGDAIRDNIFIEYLKIWAQYYIDHPNSYKRDNDNKDMFDIFSTICSIYLDKALEKKQYTDQQHVSVLYKQISEQSKEITQLKKQIEELTKH